MTLLFRRVTLRVIALVGTLVLARLLQPRDYGILALGSAVVGMSHFLVSGGLGVGLVRRAQEPTREDLKAVLAFQLLVAFGLGVPVATGAALLGGAGLVTAVMMVSLPIAAFQVPAIVRTERALEYRPLVIVGVWGALSYFGFAIGAVLAGFGVVGVAAASIVRAVVRTLLFFRAVPGSRLSPRMHWPTVRGLLAFASRFQAGNLISLLRDQGLNMGVAAVGGLTALGLWSIAYRVQRQAFLIFGPLRRVGFPALSRLRAAGEDLEPILMRTTALIAVAVGAVLVGLVAAGYAFLPILLGEQWRPASTVLPWASVGLAVSGAISVAAVAFLLAVGDAARPLRAMLVSALSWVALAMALLPSLGIKGLALAWTVGSLVEAALFSRAVRQHVQVNLLRSVAVPAAASIAAGAAGLAVSAALGHGVAGGVAGGLTGEAIYLLLLIALRPHLLADALRLARRGLAMARSGA